MLDKMIDPEIAERMKDLFLPKSDRLTRVVLWPWRKVDQIIQTLTVDDEECSRLSGESQRSLAHFVCCDDYVRILIVRPRMLNMGHLVAVDDLIAPYELTPLTEIGIVCRFLIGDGPAVEFCNKFSARNQKNIAAGHVKVFRFDEWRSLDHDTKAAFSMARILEHYAFSPYTSIRERPTMKQALSGKSRDPLNRKWPAIQIVNLRIAKRPEPAEPTGRKIEVRYSVTEHMRRQPTKEGIRLIKIREHWRGPESGPVRPKTKKVYKVVK